MVAIFDFLIKYWYLFLIITIFLLFALAGYYLDEKYRFMKEKESQEIKDSPKQINDQKQNLTSLMNKQMANPDFDLPEEKKIEQL